MLHCNGDTELETICLETLKAYLKKLSTGDENSFKLHLKDIIDTIKGNLLPDAKLFETTSKIILNITQASEATARVTAKEILPILTNTYNITKTPAHQVKLLRVLVCFFIILKDIFPDGFHLDELQQIPLLSVESLNHADVEMKITAWNSVGVIELSEVLKACVFEIIRVNLTQNLELPLREAFLTCFKTLAIKYPEEIENEVIRKIEISNVVNLKCFLEALARISTHKQLMRVVFPIIMRHCLGNLDEAAEGFICLRDILEAQENSDIPIYLIENLNAITSVINWVLNVNNEKRELLENISVVLKILVGSLNVQQQEQLLTTEITQIVLKYKETQNIIHIVLLNGLLLRFHGQVVVNNEIIETIFLIAFTKNYPEYINDMSVQLFANILNKIQNEQILSNFLRETLNRCDNETSQIVIKIVSWVTKALVMRNHQQTNFWIDKVR